ncbi:JmjC domain-containing histone demethylation protein 1, partial [Cladochytrium tenue]
MTSTAPTPSPSPQLLPTSTHLTVDNTVACVPARRPQSHPAPDAPNQPLRKRRRSSSASASASASPEASSPAADVSVADSAAALPGKRFCYCRSPWEGNGRRFMLRDDAERFARFHCRERKSRTQIDYSELNRGVAEDEQRWAKLVAAKRFAPNKFPYVNGEDVTLDWVRRTGLREPFIVEDPDGLDMRMPDPSITVSDIADACGRDRVIEAMEVSSQLDKQVTLGEWAEYFALPEAKRKKLLNVISMEMSDSPIGRQIVRPRIVRQLDWTETVWPPRSEQAEFPAVQIYYFGASSVYYHLLSGQKIFYFVRPTPLNLKKYEKWSSSPEQHRMFFGDEVKECIQVRVNPGNTYVMCSRGVKIHAVFTPEDSIVIGGNFLQGLDMSTQLAVYGIENRTGVPPKFRFPFFVQMQWHAARKYLADLTRGGASALSRWELDGLTRLFDFLCHEAHDAHHPSSSAAVRAAARANIPVAAVPDPRALLAALAAAILAANPAAASTVVASLAVLDNPAAATGLVPLNPPRKLRLKLPPPGDRPGGADGSSPRSSPSAPGSPTPDSGSDVALDSDPDDND